MKASTIIKIIVVIVVIVIAANIFISNYKSSYDEMIHDWRKQKNLFLKTASESPIEDKDAFKELNYFDPNIKFKVEAHLTFLHDSIPLVMLRTDGKKAKYLKYAIASFELEKKEYRVILLKSTNSKEHENVLFLPFTDKTSGELTYGGGRYIDLKLEEPDKVVIDFNYAYNPYCAYNPRFSCPIPPKENIIETEILAGEKIYEKPSHDTPDSLKTN